MNGRITADSSFDRFLALQVQRIAPRLATHVTGAHKPTMDADYLWATRFTPGHEWARQTRQRRRRA